MPDAHSSVAAHYSKIAKGLQRQPAEGDGPVLRRLAELPKPLAVLAAWDVAAVQVAELCHKARLAVPSQVAILGVDDDELLCNGAALARFFRRETGLSPRAWRKGARGP